MKKFLLSIFAVMLAVFSVQAEEYSYTFTSKQFSANGTNTLNGVSWTLDGNGSYWGYDGTKGQQFGSGNAPYKSLTLSTSDIKGEITKIVINTSGASSIAGSCTVTVGGAQFGSAITLTKTATSYTLIGSASGDIVLSYTQTSSKAIYIKSIAVTYTVDEEGGDAEEPVVETVATPVISPESTTFNEGESLFVAIETETDDAEIYYTLDGTEPSADNGELYEGEIEITETTTVKAIAVKDGWNDSEVVEVKYTKTVVIEGGIVDVLNRELTGAEGTTYSSWSDKTSKSSAVYAGQSAGGNNAIQLRSTNSNSGIVTTVSGGKAKKITIDWNANTAQARELWVYGSNTAYTSPADLYKSDTYGDKLAEIACGTSEFVIEGDYKYIGLRSGSGAMYLNSIEITWVAEKADSYTLSVSEAGWATLFLDFNAAIPAEVETYTVTAVNNGYVTLTPVEGVLPANTGVIVKAAEGEYNFVSSTDEATNVDGNLLEGSAAAEEKDFEAYVLGNDGGVGLYKAKMTDGVWLNNANKAYLPASAVPAANNAASFSFRFEGGTTGISEVKGDSGNVKTIYDLTGRQVNAVERGIYIVNGKKVLVK